MKKLSSALLILSLSACNTIPKRNEVTQTPVSNARAVPHKGAVLAGDYPDPSLIRVGQTYWAVATSSAWAPIFPIFRSSDLANWQVVASVFQKQPAWSKGDYWAPEIAQMGKTFYVYYSARNRKTSKMCVGVATSESPSGPYKDHGTVVCGTIGSIDPAPVVDDNGDKYLVWKEDGNSIRKPTPIFIQKLSEDGLHLTGRANQTITNDSTWERNLVEAPFILKHDGTWFLFYSGNGCCGRDCNYALGVARAKKLSGPWEKNPNNPILQGNDKWKCPGHGSIVQDEKGNDVLLYHAYDPNDFVFVGRQAMADQVDWKKDKEGNVWPSINNGQGPSTHAGGFLNHILRNEEHNFADDFSSGELVAGWQWPKDREPSYKVVAHDKMNELVLRAPPAKKGEALDYTMRIVARSSTVGDYTAIAVLNTNDMSAQAVAGIAAYGDEKNAVGLSYVDKHLEVWTRDEGRTLGLEQIALPDHSVTNRLWLRMSVENGHTYHFAFSDNGRNWQEAGRILRDGYHLPPWDLGVRIALTVGAGEAHFTLFKVEPK